MEFMQEFQNKSLKEFLHIERNIAEDSFGEIAKEILWDIFIKAFEKFLKILEEFLLKSFVKFLKETLVGFLEKFSKQLLDYI